MNSRPEPYLVHFYESIKEFLFSIQVPSEYYSSALVLALKTLADYMEIDLRITKKISIEEAVNCFLIAFEVPDLGCSDYLEIALPALCRAAEYLPLKGISKYTYMYILAL